MTAVKFPILIEQRASFNLEVSMTDGDGFPINLTGATLAGQIRAIASSSTSLVAFTTAIIGDPHAGNFSISLSASDTSSIPISDTQMADVGITEYAYDVIVTLASGQVIRALYGVAKVSPGVTR